MAHHRTGEAWRPATGPRGQRGGGRPGRRASVRQAHKQAERGGGQSGGQASLVVVSAASHHSVPKAAFSGCHACRRLLAQPVAPPAFAGRACLLPGSPERPQRVITAAPPLPPCSGFLTFPPDFTCVSRPASTRIPEELALFPNSSPSSSCAAVQRLFLLLNGSRGIYYCRGVDRTSYRCLTASSLSNPQPGFIANQRWRQPPRHCKVRHRRRLGQLVFR